MLLRIIDQSNTEGQTDRTEIVFESEKHTIRFEAASKSCFLSKSFKQQLNWYFSDYLCAIPEPENDRDSIGKLLRIGQAVGDSLLGEDHELIKVKETIEDEGFANLSVRIESERPAFFGEPWESVILPASKYVLSAASRSFARVFTSINTGDSEVHHELSKTTPLRLLHIVARHSTAEKGSLPSNALGFSTEILDFDGAIDYEIWPGGKWLDLEKRLLQNTRPIHVLLYDGPVFNSEGESPAILLPGHLSGPDIKVSVAELASLLAAEKSVLMLLQIDNRSLPPPSEHSKGQAGDSVATLLAEVSRVALGCGIDNIIGLNQVTDPWTASQCFHALLSGLAGGLTVAQAAVEARKKLQLKLESGLFSVKPRPFQCWPLLSHYEKGPVTFFVEPRQPRSLVETENYKALRQRLHGFHYENLPPAAVAGSDGIFLPGLSLSRQSVLLLSGVPGSGKTHTVHQLAFYAARRDVRHAFYFDFGEHHYTTEDALLMIKPVLELELSASRAAVMDELHSSPCLFALDNLTPRQAISDTAVPESEAEAWIEFIDELSRHRHIVIVTCLPREQQQLSSLITPAVSIPTGRLGLAEQQFLVAQTLRKRKSNVFEENADYHRLLSLLRGHPWLTVRMATLLEQQHQAAILCRELEPLMTGQCSDPVAQFYHWQWGKLSPVCRRWAMLLASLPDVLVEMIGLTFSESSVFESAAQLHQLLDDNSPVKMTAPFTETVGQLEACGFLRGHPSGRVIDERALTFIKTMREQDEFWQMNNKEVNALLSQVIAESLYRLWQLMQEKPNQNIVYNLINNRSLWAKHLERLWFAESFTDFVKLLDTITLLLRQHQIERELAEWCADLLKRSGVTARVDVEKADKMITELKLLAHAVNSADSCEQGNIGDAIALWQQWMDQLSTEDTKNHAGLFYHGIQFLDKAYRQSKNWQALQALSSLACRHYSKQGIWPRVVPHLLTKAQCAFELGDEKAGLEREDELVALLEGADSESFPPAYAIQLIINIISARITRRHTDRARDLLELVKSKADIEPFKPLLDTLQADLHYHTGQFEQALPLYCALWTGTAQTGSKGHLQTQLLAIKQALGAAVFAPLYAKYAGNTPLQDGD